MSAYKNIDDGKTVDELISDFRINPEDFSEEKRQRLKTLLKGKDEVNYLSADEKAILDILS